MILVTLRRKVALAASRCVKQGGRAASDCLRPGCCWCCWCTPTLLLHLLCATLQQLQQLLLMLLMLLCAICCCANGGHHCCCCHATGSSAMTERTA